ncbi:MAG: hypothetical protein HQ564_04955 [Candidatus Saganbacteria bacterium]|nr:hypothetical protein [Candidatus Saganbacteria bacterium]
MLSINGIRPIGLGKKFLSSKITSGGTTPSSPTGSSPGVFSPSTLPPTGYIAYGKSGEATVLTEEKFHRMLREGEIAIASRFSTDSDFIVLKEAFDEYARAIYEYERIMATKRIGGSAFSRNLFFDLESEILKGSSPPNMRHLSFMLKETAEMGCDYITAMAILIHNFPDKKIKQIFSEIKGGSRRKRKTLSSVIEAKELFDRLNSLYYQPSPKRPPDEIRTCLRAMVKLSKGKSKALTIFFAHKLSSIKMQTSDANDITFRTVGEMCAPLAEWFSKRSMATKLRNEAYRLHDPINYSRLEHEIEEAMDMSRREAELFLSRIQQNISSELATKPFGLLVARTRVKTPWGAAAKIEYKPEDYPDIDLMQDLLAGLFITKKTASLQELLETIPKALGDNFSAFSFKDKQVETKRYKIDGEVILVHHVGVILKGGNSLELQFMDQDAYRIIERGHRAHWAYKLELLTGQKFDREFLEACSKKMNGNFEHDLKVVYAALSPWTYVFWKGKTRIRPKQLPAGSLPFDLAASIANRGNIYLYGGLKIRKIWEKNKQTRKGGENYVLQDGDICHVLLDRSEDYLVGLAEKNKRTLVTTKRAKLYLQYYTRDLFDFASSEGKKIIFDLLHIRRQMSRHSHKKLSIVKDSLGLANLQELFAYIFLNKAEKLLASELAERLGKD